MEDSYHEGGEVISEKRVRRRRNGEGNGAHDQTSVFLSFSTINVHGLKKKVP